MAIKSEKKWGKGRVNESLFHYSINAYSLLTIALRETEKKTRDMRIQAILRGEFSHHEIGQTVGLKTVNLTSSSSGVTFVFVESRLHSVG